ncbi:MAG: RNA 3'-terminal phosphate cyclase [Candidatus Aenigmarchaeota archaeon]|nr:RNA 3'-terminal phosphate cyclase [Candidatus Aenigmarchaeota archaeon]
MIEIDGSYKEAGGQIIRTAIGLSAVTGKPCRIFNIRKGRSQPGLKAQHLSGINAVAKLCNAKTDGFKIGSEKIEFHPGNLSHKPLKIDIGTAGSVTLVLQSLIIPAIHTDKELVFKVIGGTNVAWSPTVEYFQHIFCDFLKKMGIDIHIDTKRYGFYPKGGGIVNVTVHPGDIVPLRLEERGKMIRADAWSVASKTLEKPRVAERQIEGVKQIEIEKKNVQYVDSNSTGSSLHMHAHYENCKLGASVLGERGKLAENVGEEAASLLKKQMESNACLDEWMGDQILPYNALAGKSRVTVSKITNHLLTNIWAIEKFLPVKFQIERGVPSTVSIKMQ